MVFLIFVIIAILRLFLKLQKGCYIMEMIGTILLYLMLVIVKSWRPQKVLKKLQNMEIKNTSKFSTQFQCRRWPEIKFVKISLVSWLLILLAHQKRCQTSGKEGGYVFSVLLENYRTFKWKKYFGTETEFGTRFQLNRSC